MSAIALVAFSRAVCADPTNPDAWNNLASAIKPRQQWKEAGVAYQRSLVLQPNSGDSWRNLGVLLADMADMTGGRLAYRRALAIRPDDVGLAFKAAMTFPTIVGSDVEIDSIRLRIIRDLDQLVKRGTLIDDPLLEVGLPNFYLAYHGRNDRDIQTKIARAYLVLSPGLAWCAPHCVVPMPRNPLRRIRIGFFSVFFHDHSIRYVAEGVVQKLDRSRFEVFLITDVGPLDVAPFPPHEVPDRHLEVPHDLGVARKIIANAALDILVYCDIGMEPMSYYLAFARLAPVQCVMQGHPVTTGIPNVDYFLSSAWMEPDDFHEHYSETCVQLPELTFHYLREPEATPGTRSDYGLPEVGSLYFCPQTLFKFHPHFDKMLRDILEQDPTGWLILLKDYSESRTQELAKRLRSSLCKAADRVIWLDRMSRPKYYTLLMLSDVMLDTPYFSGGNTTVQSLALGVPTVTYASPHVRGRVTIGWARVLDCMDLVAGTAADYARIAVGCATDSAFRGSVQKRMLVNRGALFQRPDVVREYASFLESALDSALAGVSSAIDCDDDSDGVA
ncbi:MAG: hypothetical protein CMM47_11210 [Rhodospirillaceae bacterium]|nr:hypothetical protein [Rhodospirillaceae bacterium]